MSAAKKAAITNLDRSSPVDTWPDFDGKHTEIVRKANSESGWKFEDKNWSPCTEDGEKKVLGDRVFGEKRARNIEKWERASDLGYELFVDGANCADIV